MAARPPSEALKKPRPAPKGPEFAPQQAFRQAAVDLAAVLGWHGDEDDWLQNDITIADARNYLQQKLHEAHQASVTGQQMPDYTEVYEHLAVDTDAEDEAVMAAFEAAYATGKDKAFIEAQLVRFGFIKAVLHGSAGAVLAAAGRVIQG